MEKINIIIIGGGGFGREVLWTIRDYNKINDLYSVIGFIDDKLTSGTVIDQIPVLGDLNWLLENYKSSVSCIIAIGDCIEKRNIHEKLKSMNVVYAKIIHPSVISSSSIKIGEGTIIQAGCILTVDIVIGNHVHININSTIGHDSIIEDFTTINPGTIINGKTIVGTSTYVGSGTVMKQGVKIGSNSIIGAGSVLINDVPDKSLYVGVPAKLKKQL